MHDCDKAPPKRCFSCGQWGHLKSECTIGQSCFICGDKSHISPNCPNSIRSKGQQVSTFAPATLNPSSPANTVKNVKLFPIFGNRSAPNPNHTNSDSLPVSSPNHQASASSKTSTHHKTPHNSDLYSQVYLFYQTKLHTHHMEMAFPISKHKNDSKKISDNVKYSSSNI